MIHSFLLIGQSNMAGRGDIGDVAPIDNPSLKVLRNGRWQRLFVPVNPDRPFSGVNLAESFADAYQRAHGVEVGLIPCADGGTRIDQWREGGLLFDHAVFQARLAERTSTSTVPRRAVPTRAKRVRAVPLSPTLTCACSAVATEESMVASSDRRLMRLECITQ